MPSKKKTPQVYRLTINEKQAWVISAALEVFSRLGMGQINFALDYLPLKNRLHDTDWHEDVRRVEAILATHNRGGVDGWTSHTGISNASDDAKTSFDLYQVVRKQLAWDHAIANGIVESHESPRNWKEMMGCQFDDPMKMGPEPLAVIENVK